ncbi:MAG: type II secretion system protein [Candidatus Nealsonbacteria bacterium]|nr:type II secretion system protein [Candidatus Nealsonbacteria bacterium]
MKENKGFTLIELLVVIAIIGILSSIVLVSLGSTRGKARDARRQSDVRQMGLAMEMYYDSHNSVYTTTDPMTTGVTNFLSPFPQDPTAGKSYQWVTNSGAACGGAAIGQWYCIWATTEQGTQAGMNMVIFANQRGTKSTNTDGATWAAMTTRMNTYCCSW